MLLNEGLAQIDDYVDLLVVDYLALNNSYQSQLGFLKNDPSMLYDFELSLSYQDGPIYLSFVGQDS